MAIKEAHYRHCSIELLNRLYVIHSPTGSEWPLISFVREYVTTHIPEAEVRMDRLGNLYIKVDRFNGLKFQEFNGYPTLACHLDQVQALHSDDFEVKQEDDILYGWSEQNQRREGLGADDKNGIFICLRCLEECPRLKVYMAVGEEKGCIGSNRADMSFFEDSLYVLEPDCKGGEELHTNLKGIPCASPEFEQALHETWVASFTPPFGGDGGGLTPGKGSDIFALTLNGIGVSCANIPAGYHLPHKDDEYTVIAELEHTLAFIRHFVTNEHRRFPHTYKTYTQQMIEGTNR